MLKLIGLSLILTASTVAGLRLAAVVKRQQTQTLALIDAVLRIRHELQCRLTPLPEIFCALQAGRETAISAFFTELSQTLAAGSGCTVSYACRRALTKTQGLCLPAAVRQTLLSLFDTLGLYDLEGNLQVLDLALTRLREQAAALRAEAPGRCRSFVTLGVCTGLAVAVVLL